MVGVGPQKSKYELLNPVVLEKQVKALQEQIQNMESAHRQKEYALKEQMKVMKDQKNEMVEEYETRLKRAVDWYDSQFYSKAYFKVCGLI